jgi:hypothetical protein
MVSESESKVGAIPTFPLRMQRALRTRVEVAARANRRSVNSEIVARLAQSFDMAAPIEAGGPIASETAMEALELAKEVNGSVGALITRVNALEAWVKKLEE